MRSTPHDNVLQFPEDAMDPLALEVADLITDYGYDEVRAAVEVHRPVPEPTARRSRGWRT